MKVPGIHLCDKHFVRFLNETGAEVNIGNDVLWVPARPLPYYSITQRWKAAWLVLTGKADALKWVGQ